MKKCALFFRKNIAFVLLVLLVLAGNLKAQEKAMYFNKAWRDSVAEYHGRLTAYQQELSSYDFAMSLAVLPVVGESYVDRTGAGFAFLGGRVLALAATTIGTVRLIEGKPTLPLNIGLIAGGLVSYYLLKLWEISDVMHSVSHENEALVKQYGIYTSDVEPGSIRYPQGNWPDSVTRWPESRRPKDARAAVDRPLPMSSK